MESFNFKSKDYKRCGSCLFVEGGEEVEFNNGNKDLAYYCGCSRIIQKDNKEYVEYDKASDIIVFHHQKCCRNYRSAFQYKLKVLSKEEIKELFREFKNFDKTISIYNIIKL